MDTVHGQRTFDILGTRVAAAVPENVECPLSLVRRPLHLSVVRLTGSPIVHVTSVHGIRRACFVTPDPSFPTP